MLMGTVSGYELLSLLSIFWAGKDKNYWFCISDNFIHHLGSWFKPFQETSVRLLIVFFTLAQFIQNLGHNKTKFIIRRELFQTRSRSTAQWRVCRNEYFSNYFNEIGMFNIFNIISIGKLGAIVSSVEFFQFIL
jgi:hypothetical protein